MDSANATRVEEQAATSSSSAITETESEFYKEVLQSPEQYPQDIVEKALDEDLKK